MRRISFLWIVLFIFFASNLVFSDFSFSAEIDLEELSGVEGEAEEQTGLYELLHDLIENPLDINTAAEAQLRALPWISPESARTLVSYRQTNGPLEDLSELLHITAIDSALLEVLRHFVRVKKKEKPFPLVLSGRHRFYIKSGVENKDVYCAGKLYNRLTGNWGENVRFGFLSEKDPGETAFDDLAVGFVHLMLPTIQSDILLGNFSLEYGQGLVFGGSYHSVKGSNPVFSGRKRSRGLVPYRSSGENSALSGIGLNTRIGLSEFVVFYSSSQRDADIVQDTVRARPTTGYHRTVSEMRRKDALNEKVLGFNGQINLSSQGKFGLCMLSSRFDHFIQSDDRSQIFSFRGDISRIAGLYFEWTQNGVNYFGEFARSLSGGNALYAGAVIWQKPFNIIMTIRNYQKDHYSHYGAGLADGNDIRNERGYYFGWILKKGKFRCSLSFDQFRHDVPTSSTPMPWSGYEAVLLAEYRPLKRLQGQIRFRTKQAQTQGRYEDCFGNSVVRMLCRDKNQCRFQIEFNSRRKLRIRSRLEFSWTRWNLYSFPVAGATDTLGTMVYHDVRIPISSILSVQVRYTYFDSPNADLRFYPYESDAPGFSRMFALSGRGERCYAAVGIKKMKYAVFIKYGVIFFDNRYAQTDLDESIHCVERDLTLQIDWNL